MKTYIGIDPGLDGAVAMLHGDGRLEVHDPPVFEVRSGKKTHRRFSPTGMAALLDPFCGDEALVCLEKVHSMPKQGVASSFNFGVGFGIWLGILAALALPMELVTPQRWKKAMMDGMGKDKDASRQRAQELWPGAPLTLKKHHGRADALLIAEYVRRLQL